MWKIVEIINLTSPREQVLLSGGGDLLDLVGGPEGSSYRVVVTNIGFLDLVDTGRGNGGWGINLNGLLFLYEGEGVVHLTFKSNGTFQATGGSNEVTGHLKPMPIISPSDIYLLQEMMDLKLVPYQNIPDAPGKSPEEIEQLGRVYFPFTEHSTLLAYSVYDWTTPSFFRCVLFKCFAYSGIVDHPLDQKAIANTMDIKLATFYTTRQGFHALFIDGSSDK